MLESQRGEAGLEWKQCGRGLQGPCCVPQLGSHVTGMRFIISEAKFCLELARRTKLANGSSSIPPVPKPAGMEQGYPGLSWSFVHRI